ncbi:MAG TPA: hypothetical protein VEA69_14165, partial [Tepidisphaeraceae bacterium]|nr:hypothetical protein [Tepidisphaeraceae bacterium]
MSSVAQLSLPRSIPRGPVTGLVLRAWHGEIATGEARDRAATRWRLLIALGTQALVIGLCALIANLFRDAQQGRTGALLAGALVGVV